MTYDVLILGSGIAGLSTALAAAPRRVAVLTRGQLGEDGASRWAQGGIAAALGDDDSPALHARDTLAAGLQRNDADAVARLTGAAAAAVAWLERLGACFDRDEGGQLRLGREAAHARARIVHAQGDASGAEVMRCLRAAALAAPHITRLEQHEARQLLCQDGRVVGVRACGAQGEREVLADHVVLATGGIGALYRYTTNPPESDGSGLALAMRAGAAVADMEFVQFHPTALAPASDAGGQLPLLTEALRGAGAVLLNDAGRRFLLAQVREAELAPRDVVARAVWAELQRGQRVWLDATQAVGGDFPRRFPTVFAACMARGIDPRSMPMPVVPAQHYHMGGVRVDAASRSSLPGLYAVGEVACSGVHGANRLASNSLLEGLVFGRGLGALLAQARRPPRGERGRSGAALAPAETSADGDTARARELADLMWRHAGLVRDGAGLAQAGATIQAWQRQWSAPPLRGRLAVARAIVAAAAQRRQGIGAHWRADDALAQAG